MDIERAAVAACWQQLKRRYAWTMVDDEDRLIDQVMAAIEDAPPGQAGPARQIEISLHRVYNAYLYEAFFGGVRRPDDPAAAARSEAACRELNAMMRRLPALRGYSDAIQNDVIQSVFMRLVAAPASVKSPGSLTAWVIWQVRAALKSLISPPRCNNRPVVALALDDPAARVMPDASADLARVEVRLRNLELDQVLRQILSPFQRAVVVLAMIECYPDREVARMLDVRVTRVYVEKNRARQKMLASARLLQFLAACTDDLELAEGSDG